MLHRLPGTSFTGPAGVTKDIRMRGLDKAYAQFLINGVPVPSAKQERQIQIDSLPADMIERIEIMRNRKLLPPSRAVCRRGAVRRRWALL